MNKLNRNGVTVTRIDFDLAKNVFQVHGVDANGEAVVGRKIGRAAVVDYFRKFAPCEVAMEACSSSHHWARQFMALGHSVKLIPPARSRMCGITGLRGRQFSFPKFHLIWRPRNSVPVIPP